MQNNASEEMVKRLMERQGFTCVAEPQWIAEGMKPDFFCTGPAELWVEVKSFGQTRAEETCEHVWGWFKSPRRINGPGASISICYASDVTEQHVKEALKRVKRILRRHDQYNSLWVIIPHDPDYTKDVELSLCERGQEHLILSAKSKSDRYGTPCPRLDIMPDEKIHVCESGVCKERRAEELGLDSEDVTLAVLVKPWKHDEISLSSSSEITGAKTGWPDSERLHRDAQNAANKFRNGMRYKHAPSILIWVVENDSKASQTVRIHSLMKVLYGDPTLVWRSSNPDAASVIHGKGAFWNRKKNTSVSAACYVSNSEAIRLIHNPFAKCPLPVGLIGCEEYLGQENGRVQHIR